VPSKLHVTTAAVSSQKRDLHKERADALAAEVQAQLTLQVLRPPFPLVHVPVQVHVHVTCHLWACS